MREVLISLELWGAPLLVNAEDDDEVSALLGIAVRRPVISWIEQDADEETRLPAIYEVDAENQELDPCYLSKQKLVPIIEEMLGKDAVYEIQTLTFHANFQI